MNRNPLPYIAIILILTVLALACRLGTERGATFPTPTFTKTPRPTFTPTPVATPTFTPTFTPTPEPFTPTPTPSPTPAVPQTAVVIGTRANVRQGPGVVYPIIGQVSGGTQFEIRARNSKGDWIKVCCVDGKEGWVSTSLLSIPGEIAMINITTEIPPTPTPRPRPPTPTPVPVPTPTPAPAWTYMYVPGSMRTAPNCGAVWFRIKVVDSAGNPINGVVVELNWYDNWAYMSTGINIPGIYEPPGEVGFTPLGPEYYQPPQPIVFRIRLVADNTPNIRIGLTKSPPPGLRDLSDTVVITFENCNKAGQFDNITFRKVR